MRESTLWSLISAGTAIAAGIAVRNGTRKVYERKVGKAPLDPYERDVRWRDALVWGAASGILVGVARVAGRRLGSEALPRGQRSEERRAGKAARSRLAPDRYA
ncbi:DUF4235 domain-containing protein, partial [Modicisalibacter tunisiensis]|uniref:DUF4235 domain-containing protein n=1 Tax=Modicisalibacter tunisiensis TaxID=390637 RepID=UPI001CCBC3BA